MKYSDLELYRWRFHNDIYIHTVNSMRPDNDPILMWPDYWKNYGAFVSVMPRATGKSRMLVALSKAISNKENELSGDYLIIYNFKKSMKSYIRAGLSTDKLFYGGFLNHSQFSSTNHNDIHLMIDEFQYMKDIKLTKILNYNWKSVSMVGTLL